MELSIEYMYITDPLSNPGHVVALLMKGHQICHFVSKQNVSFELNRTTDKCIIISG